jgi:sarcosine oxidase subunit beta
MHAAVVGAGAVGVTAAHDLAQGGATVTLYERDTVGSGATGRAAGICYDAFAEDRDAAVAARALDRFRQVAADSETFDLEPCPYLWFAREGDDRHADAIREQVPRMQAHDRHVDLLEPAAVREQLPALRTPVAVAAVAHDAVVTEPSAYASAMADRARAAGVEIREGVAATVESGPVVETRRGRESYDAVLVAAGAHTGRLLAAAGHPLAVKPYRVQALQTTRTTVAGLPTVYDATEGYYLRPRAGGLLVGDGTEEREFDPEEWRRDADAAFVDASQGRVAEALGRRVGVRRAWAGLCTATPDRDPLVGAVGDGLYAATGFHGHGFMRAPALGEAVADEMLGKADIDGFAPTRFDGDEAFRVVEGMTVD